MRRSPVAFLAPLAFYVGCGILGPGDCVAIGRFALSVIVQDSASRQAPAAELRVIASDGAYADTATIGSPHSSGIAFWLAPERTGSYLLTVQATGYREWSKQGVGVTRSTDKCDYLRTVTILARLQR